jgi:uncharacterized protein DUF4386
MDRSANGDSGILRWGGLAGILGGLLFIFVFVFVGVVVGPDPAGPAGAITRFPEIRALRTIENALYLAVLLLWVVHVIALYRPLRGPSSGPALAGSTLSIVGLAVMAIGALPHAASVPLADLYHASGTTVADQATLVIAWQATQAIFNTSLVTGLVILPLGLAGLGVAMLRSPAFGRGYGWASLALGVVGGVTAVALLVDPPSFVAVVGIFALIVFHIAVGWRMYSASRRHGAVATRGIEHGGTPVGTTVG